MCRNLQLLGSGADAHASKTVLGEPPRVGHALQTWQGWGCPSSTCDQFEK